MSYNATVPSTTAGVVIPNSTTQAWSDGLNGIQAAWDTYTPTWTATTTNPTLGNGTIAGFYLRVGKTVDFMVTLTLGSTSTVGVGNYFLSLPTAFTIGNYPWVFDGKLYDSSAAATYAMKAEVVTAGITGASLRLLVDPATAGASLRNATNAVPVIPATGDVYFVYGRYFTT